MAEYGVTVHNLSPLLIRAKRSREQFTEGLDYIPGSTFRGAMAAHYLQSRGPDEDFETIFVKERVRFGNLLPGTADEPGRHLPSTARLCKRHGWDHQSSLTDALLRLELADSLDDPLPLEDVAWAYCPHPQCQQAHNKRDRARGSQYYLQRGYSPVTVHRRLRTGTAIDRGTGTVYPRMLFSSEVLEENQHFWGTVVITGDDQEAENLFNRLQAILPTGTEVWMGAARSRGLGQVQLDWAVPSPTLGEIQRRWDNLNQAITGLWQKYQMQPTGYYFSLTLESDALIRDEAQRPVTALENGRLLGLPKAELRRHVIVPAMAVGWNAQQGLPKPNVPALGRGSVLLFRVVTDDVPATQQRLAMMEAEGVGERRGEGYGRMKVCDPFHYDFVH